MNLRKIGGMLLLLPLGACATITRGTHQAYVIESEPPGATAKLSTGVQCVTPCALNLKRKHGFTVDLTREGYEPVHASVASGVSGGGAAGMAGNVILGGIIGAVVDGTNGSMNELKPNPLRVKMIPLGADAAASTGAASVASNSGPRKVRAQTESGFCLDVPTDYVGTGAANSPAITSGMPRCSELGAMSE